MDDTITYLLVATVVAGAVMVWDVVVRPIDRVARRWIEFHVRRAIGDDEGPR